jgi:hypothetical protein
MVVVSSLKIPIVAILFVRSKETLIRLIALYKVLVSVIGIPVGIKIASWKGICQFCHDFIKFKISFQGV